MISANVAVAINLDVIRGNVARIAELVKTQVWPTIKADAYGLGAAEVTRAICDQVSGWCVFALQEAQAVELFKSTGKPAITLGPPATLDSQIWIDAGVRPAITTVDQAIKLRRARPILCVDTGMQRFTCPPEHVDEVLGAGGIDQAFTHATRMEHVQELHRLVDGKVSMMHAAASALLDQPEARLDAVRPGFACYRGAVRITAALQDARISRGPIGYTGWQSETGHHGVIIAGYSNGIRTGPVIINGRRQRICEVGMQSAYVTLDAADKIGDPVTLLGDGLTEADVAFAQNTTPHEVMFRLSGAGIRAYQG